MTAAELLREAQARQLSVRADRGKLIVRGPKSADADFIHRLLARKAELLVYLTAPASGPPGSAATAPDLSSSEPRPDLPERDEAAAHLAAVRQRVETILQRVAGRADAAAVKVINDGWEIAAQFLRNWNQEIARSWSPTDLLFGLLKDQVRRAENLRRNQTEETGRRGR